MCVCVCFFFCINTFYFIFSNKKSFYLYLRICMSVWTTWIRYKNAWVVTPFAIHFLLRYMSGVRCNWFSRRFTTTHCRFTTRLLLIYFLPRLYYTVVYTVTFSSYYCFFILFFYVVYTIYIILKSIKKTNSSLEFRVWCFNCGLLIIVSFFVKLK